MTREWKPGRYRHFKGKEYELLYLQGRVNEMVKPPYDQIHLSMGAGRIVTTQLKRMFPRLHRLYRKNRGYGDSE